MTKNDPSFFVKEKILTLMRHPFPAVVCCHPYPVIVRKGAICPNTWRIVLLLSGERKYQYGDGKQAVERMLEPGEVLLLPPRGSVWCEEQGCFDMLSVVCGCTIVRFVSKKRTWSDPVEHNPDLFFHCGASQKKCLELLMRALASSVIHGGAVEAIWNALLHECAYILDLPNDCTAGTSHYLLEKILVYIEEHLGAELSCDVVGEQFGVRGNYISQIFSRHMNCGFSEYLTKLRMEQACGLLEHSGMKIGAISAACGFRQTNYFIRVFRRHYSCTPLQYRIGFRSQQGNGI